MLLIKFPKIWVSTTAITFCLCVSWGGPHVGPMNFVIWVVYMSVFPKQILFDMHQFVFVILSASVPKQNLFDVHQFLCSHVVVLLYYYGSLMCTVYKTYHVKSTKIILQQTRTTQFWYPVFDGLTEKCRKIDQPVIQSFDVFLVFCLNKFLNKQSPCWWWQ